MTEIVVILLLVLANGLFSGAEIAILTLRKTRLAELVEAGRRGAASLQRLRGDPESFLATVQIGITVVSAAAAAFGGAALAGPIAGGLSAVGVPERAANEVALGLVVALVSFLSLVLGELVPKSLAIRYAEGYALAVSGPLSGLSRAARPLVKVLTFCSNLVLRIVGDRTSFAESRLSREELQTLVEESAATGALHPRAAEIAGRALDLHGLRISSVMTPRPSIVGLPLGASREEIREVLREARFSRLPVYEGGLDQVRGYVLVREVLVRLLSSDQVSVRELVHDAPFLPETAEAVEALSLLQSTGVPMAFVVDEQGGLAGLVTVENLVEELVGEIRHEKESAQASIRKETDSSWIVDGTAPVRDVNREADLELPVEGEPYSTVAGLLLHRLGRIPQAGEGADLSDAGVRIEVLEGSDRRVVRVRIRRLS